MKIVARILICTCLMMLPLLPAQGQETDRKQTYAIGIKASTIGFGGDFIYGFSKDISFRLGIDKLGYQTPVNFSEQGISYNGHIQANMGTISLLGDFYLTKYLYVSAGAGYNFFNIGFTGQAAESLPFGDIEIPAEMIGTFEFNLHPANRISPYLGLGLGRTIGLNKKLGFSADFGFYYQGAPEIDIVSDGLLSPTSNPEHKHAAKLEKQVSQYTVYPVLRLLLSYRISE